MYCKNCGHEIDDRAVICVHCGVATDNMKYMNSGKANQSEPAKPLNVLALVGLILSVIGLFGGNYLFLVPSVVGLVLSIIGMAKAKKYSYYALAVGALVASIVSLVVWAMIWAFAFAVIIGEYGWYYGVTFALMSI